MKPCATTWVLMKRSIFYSGSWALPCVWMGHLDENGMRRDPARAQPAFTKIAHARGDVLTLCCLQVRSLGALTTPWLAVDASRDTPPVPLLQSRTSLSGGADAGPRACNYSADAAELRARAINVATEGVNSAWYPAVRALRFRSRARRTSALSARATSCERGKARTSESSDSR